MGGSDVIMAPQRGNALGTCSIEVLTLDEVEVPERNMPTNGGAKSATPIPADHRTHRERWHDFAQEMLDKWLSYRDDNGELLKTRPHWAKEWSAFKIDGQCWAERLREVSYKDEIAEFKCILARLGQRDGWTLADLKARFSNDLLDKLILFDVDAAEASIEGEEQHADSLQMLTDRVPTEKVVKQYWDKSITVPHGVVEAKRLMKSVFCRDGTEEGYAEYEEVSSTSSAESELVGPRTPADPKLVVSGKEVVHSG